MKTITLTEAAHASFLAAVDYTKIWCHTHQAEVGLAEIALGGGLLAYGIQNGLIEMGKELVGVGASNLNLESMIGAAAGGSLGTLGGALLGSIGVAAAGGAIAIPAVLLAGGGALFMAAAGYTAGDLLHGFLNPPLGITDRLVNGGLFIVGVGLILDGCRRIVTDPRVRAEMSFLRDRAMHLRELCRVHFVATAHEIQSLAARLTEAAPAGALGSAAVGAAAGSAIGVTSAVGATTLLGSSTLGSVGLSLGLLAPPAWPVIVGAVAGLGLGLTAWKAGQFLVARNGRRPPPSSDDNPATT